jgi:hypothetical protein
MSEFLFWGTFIVLSYIGLYMIVTTIQEVLQNRNGS